VLIDDYVPIQKVLLNLPLGTAKAIIKPPPRTELKVYQREKYENGKDASAKRATVMSFVTQRGTSQPASNASGNFGIGRKPVSQREIREAQRENSTTINSANNNSSKERRGTQMVEKEAMEMDEDALSETYAWF
jgi:hypothetical protein